MSSEQLGKETLRNPWDHYPNPEDWEALQGGKPRVFWNPARPNTRWIVLHVYDEHGEAEKRFRNGAVVDTVPPDLKDIPFSILRIKRQNDEGTIIDRDVQVPTFMLIGHHGGPCETRSGNANYARIKNQHAYEGFIDQMRNQGMQELRYGVQNEELRLIPEKNIRNPRPLSQ